MKNSIKSSLLIVMILFFANPTINSRNLFSDNSKSKWVYVVANKSIDPAMLFTFDNNVLKVSDVSTGYIRTKKTYSAFELSVEWRWTKMKANSGVLLHIQAKDSIWPVCFQVQQKADAAGDIICMNGLWAKECTDKVKFTVPKMNPSNEKPVGEWNTMLIKSLKGCIEVFVNGELQNKISETTVNKGFIGFQAEGKSIEFRNLVIRK